MALVLRQLDERAAGHARQDVAGQARRLDVAVLVDDHHVHAAQLLQIGLGGGVHEAHLLAAVLDALVLADQRGGIVAAALGKAGAAGAGAEPLVLHPDAHRAALALEVRAGRAGDHAVVDLLRGAHAQERLGREHERTQVERVFAAGGHPGRIALDQRGARADEIVDRQLRQVQTLGRVLEAFGVRIRAEHPDRAVGVLVGLQPFEDLLRIVQHRSARIELERRVRLDAAVVPPLALGPGDVGHVVREDLSERRLVDELLPLGVRGRVVVRQHGERFGELIQRRGIMMVLFGHSQLLSCRPCDGAQ